MIKINRSSLQRVNIEKSLIYLFIFLGPIGTILTPKIFPPSTRTYYFVLLLFPLFFKKISRGTLNLAAIFLPFFLYCLLSSLFLELSDSEKEKEFPLIRFCLLAIHFLFLIGMLNYFQKNLSLSFLQKILNIYLVSYFVGLVFGLVIYIGFHLGIVRFDFLCRFNILTQYGWGILRFNPGSYANEYGVVSSFICCLLILLMFNKKKNFCKIKVLFPLIFLFSLSFIALILASTKASLISLIVSIFYMIYANKGFLNFFSPAIGALFILIFLAKVFNLSSFNFLLNGFSSIFLLTHTHVSRIEEISSSYKEFIQEPFLGTGFGSIPCLHNVYLQSLFQLGIIGSTILAMIGLAFFIKSKIYNRPKNISFLKTSDSIFINQISIIGLIHVLSFALTNHNLFHHLTWFSLLLIGINYLSKYSDNFSKQIN